MSDDVVHPRCAGIDVSKTDAKVCLRLMVDGRVRPVLETRTFKATRQGIAGLRDWLVDARVTCVVMEATGVYWKPFYYGLERAGFEVVVANAAQVKQLRGRKTDVADAAWLAKLAALDTVSGSFVPPPDVRDLRLLTRARSKMVNQSTQIVCQLEKLLEDTGMKLSSVSSKLLTKTGRTILERVCDGVTDPGQLAVGSRLRKASEAELVEALAADVREAHRALIRSYLVLIDQYAAQIDAIEHQIEAEIARFGPEIDLLCTIPGMSHTLARVFVAEAGVDMSVFPTAKHLVAWAGCSPGSNESAGKRKPAKCRKGNKHLRTAMRQAASAAAKADGTFFQAKFRRLAVRRGQGRAYIAVAASILTVIWHMLTTGELYHELGGDWYTRTATTAQRARMKANAEATLNRLGITYTITDAA